MKRATWFLALVGLYPLFGYETATLQRAVEAGVSLSLGEYQTCSLDEQGNSLCWGGDKDVTSKANSYASDKKFIEVASGGKHTCFLSEAHSVKCIGSNNYQQTEPPPLGKVLTIATGTYHSCAITETGSIDCWGFVLSDSPTVRSIKNAKALAAGGIHQCALTADGKVFCWGDNRTRQCDVPELGKVKQISAGGYHTCALLQDGSIQCWGDNRAGQQDIPKDFKAKKVTAGRLHTCAIDTNYQLHCWGQMEEAKPKTSSGIDIIAGALNTCLLSDEEPVRCWGNNDDHQNDLPAPVSNLTENNTTAYFKLASVERDFRKISKSLYLYKAGFVQGLAQTVAQFKVMVDKPVKAEFPKYCGRYFALEILGSLLETTETPYLKKNVLENYKKGMSEARLQLGLDVGQPTPFTEEVFSVALSASRLGVQKSLEFLLDENERKTAEALVADLGLLEVQSKTKGFDAKLRIELSDLLKKNEKLIKSLSIQQRTSGFGAILEKIRVYLETK